MQWSQLKKRIEERLAPSVRSRVLLGSTVYRPSQSTGRGWIAIDGNEIMDMSSHRYWMDHPWPERLQENIQQQKSFAQWQWNQSLRAYLNLPFNEIMTSTNPIIKAIGMLDARLGKRRLGRLDVSQEHDLVKRLYFLRCDSEGISPANEELQGQIDLTSRLTPRQTRHSETTRKALRENREHGKQVMSAKQKLRNLRRLIREASQETFPQDLPEQSVAKVIADAFRNTTDRQILKDILLLAESRTKLLKDARHARGVANLADQAKSWIKPLDSWRPTTNNADRQFSSLARHLWAIYDVPLFMDSAWFQDQPEQWQWFRHIGAGQNIRTAENLPIPLTKKMAHHFLGAPDNYTVEEAFRWGQVLALGGEPRLADALRGTRIVREFRDNEFWLSVLRFFVRNPMLDCERIGPIIDYIWNQRYEPRLVFIDRGIAQEDGPAQPNFSMQRRNVITLLRAVDEWHRQLGREVAGEGLQWQKSEIADFVHIEGRAKTKNMRIWRIRELLNSKELVAEGRTMTHCVASYAQSCYQGKASIWSMEVETEEGTEKRLTIEIAKNRNAIQQVRGKRNRLPTDEERDILRRWAQKVGLEISAFI